MRLLHVNLPDGYRLLHCSIDVNTDNRPCSVNIDLQDEHGAGISELTDSIGDIDIKILNKTFGIDVTSIDRDTIPIATIFGELSLEPTGKFSISGFLHE